MSRIPKLDSDDVDPEAAATFRDSGLIGPFRTGALIGQGSMACVLEAVDTRTGEPVALKVLRSELHATSEVVSRFVREGRALANLTHPNIVRVIERGTTEAGTHYLALERLEGSGLDHMIKIEKRLEPLRAIKIAIDISKALATLHARGMFHRDIKPENIFIIAQGTASEHAKLIDFGIAHVTDEELDEHSSQYTVAGKMLGTAAFSAPEQTRGEQVDARADVFSLVVTLYEMLTGKLPFKGETAVDQIRGRAVGRPLRLDGRTSGLTFHPVLSSLVMRGLSADRELRPQDGLALLRELQQCLAECQRVTSTGRAAPTCDLTSNLRAGGGAAGAMAGAGARLSSGRWWQLGLICLFVVFVAALTLVALLAAGMFGRLG